MVKPWLWLPPQVAHNISPYGLKALSLFYKKNIPSWNEFSWASLHFKNPLGIAGGVDKNAQNVEDWWRFGCGFVEVGTITPEPQSVNPGPVIKRNSQKQALWNRLGFPSHGVKAIKKRIQGLPRPYLTPLFANIGKNRSTPNSEAHKDYQRLITELEPIVDAFVVNISSPNTQGLRDLAEEKNLKSLLSPIINTRKKKTPILLKLSPDMKEQDFLRTLEVSHNEGVDGFILTNTTIQKREGLGFPKEGGGVSGRPLAPLSVKNLNLCSSYFLSQGKSPLIISVGGVLSSKDVLERINSGAHLVQTYSAVVFHGPQFFHRVSKELRHG